MNYGMRRPDILMPQQTCPSCGKSRVYRMGVSYRDRNTGANITDIQKSSALWGVIACVAAIAVLYFGVPYVFGYDSAVAEAAPLWLPVPLGLGVWFVMRLVNQRKLDVALRVHNYRCESCGHRWVGEDDHQ
jgi:predicted RNA-binding Zn-ribbon protein involved in translation (DUF1610 family)